MEKNPPKNITSVTAEQATVAIANTAENTHIIIDFDETLLLRNSTAEYINSLRPRLIGFILIIFLKILRPWIWLPLPFKGNQVRDWFLVIVPTILLPWTLLLWQQRAKKLAKDYANTELISAINSNVDAPIIIASLGFNLIINPILQHLPVRCDRLVCCRFWHGANDRKKGKLLMVQEVLSQSQLKSAILVTDSEDDLPLLQVVNQPYFAIWPLAQYTEPFKDFWLYSLVKKIKQSIAM